MIIAVSKLIGKNMIVSDSQFTQFTESLSIISSYASNDKAVQVSSQLCYYVITLITITVTTLSARLHLVVWVVVSVTGLSVLRNTQYFVFSHIVTACVL